MSRFDGDVVNLRNVSGNVEDYESHDVRAALFTVHLRDKTGSKSIVIKQAIVTVDGPMGKVLPGTLDVDDSIDVTFSSFSNSYFQRFHGQSPRPAFSHIKA